MAISCTPADLAAAAKCFQCLPSEQKQWIDTYLLAVIAKGSTDPNTLALAAKCFQCIPSGMLRRIQAYLLCQIASGGGGGPCPQDMQVAWTPTNLKLGQLIGFVTFDTTPALPGITSLTFNQSTTQEAIDIEQAAQLISVSCPNLTTITGNGYFSMDGNSALTSVSCPLLASVLSAPGVQVRNCASLTTVNFNSLTTVGAQLYFNFNASLVSLSLPSLTTVAADLNCQSCPSLTTVSVPLFLPTNGKQVLFDSCALTAASVNHILARCVANAGYVTGTVDLSGGTSAAPSGQGVADKATLIGRGVTVNTN